MNLKIVAVISAIQFLSLCVAEEPSWAWNQKEQPSPIAQKRSDEVNSTANESDSQGRHLYSEQEIYSNDTSVDDVVDSILSFGREGRNLDEYGQVYTDPSVQEALQRGDDSQARNLIKEKLCSLGLMQCDVADAEGKRFYRPPGSAIYAQGPPPPRPPFRPPHGSFGPPPGPFGPPQGPYGPPKPMPYPPSGGKFGPPRKVGYEGPILSKPPYPGHTLGPVYSGQFVDSPPSIHGGDSGITFSKPPPGSIIYGSSKPPGAIFEGVDAPYNFEHIVGEKIHVENSYAHHQQSTGLGGIGEPKPTIVVNAQGGGAGAGLSQAQAANSASLQQHVHHHFHHVDGETAKAPIVPVAVPLPSGNSITSDFASIATSSAAFAPISHVNSVNNGFELNKQVSQSAAFNAGFNSATQGGFLAGNTLSAGLGGVNGGAVRPVNGLYGSGIKPVSEPGLGSYGSGFTGSFGSNSGSFGSNAGSFGSNSGSFGSNSGSFGASSGSFGANGGSFGSSGFDQTASGIYNAAGGYQSSNGAAAGGFHSSNPEYYKKELNINVGAQGNSLTGYAQQNKYGSQYGAQFNQYSGSEDYSGLETSRQQSIDCVCVPFNQCPAADRLGRKDDLILPLDPRNLGTEIEALPEDQNNSTTTPSPANTEEVKKISKREAAQDKQSDEPEQASANAEARQLYGGRPQQCSPSQVCCRRPFRPQQQQQLGRCGTRNAHGITGRIKNPVYIDGDSEFGEYPWQVAILKKDPKESVYVCGGTVIDQLHVITAAHCVKTYGGFDLRARLGEWDVNHDVEFFPYIERDVVSVHVHPEYYAGTLDNDLAILKLDHPIDFTKSPHISPACLPDKYSDYTGARCWTTGWGKDAFGDYGKYQNILKEVDVPIINQQQCQNQLRHTRLGHQFKLHPGFVCAGGEEGKDACKGDGGGPMVCERNGVWQLVGVVSWGIGCGQVNVPGVYVRVSYYLDWINQITRSY